MVYDKLIEGVVVNIRSVYPEDAEITYNMRNDKEKARYLHKITGTIEDQKDYIVAQNKKQNDYLFLVMDKSGKPIGMRGIYNIEEKSAESGRTIGYGDAFQNMEAILLGYDFAFQTIGVERIYMNAFSDNTSVRGIQKKVGAIEIERVYFDDWASESIRSVLYKEDYYKNRDTIFKMIESYANRHLRGRKDENQI